MHPTGVDSDASEATKRQKFVFSISVHMIESISRQTKNTRRETFVNEFVGPTHDDEVKFYVSLKNIA